MPKYKDFFTKLKTDGKISIPEYDDFLSSAPDAEIPEAVVNAIEANFMTFDRASAHPEIHAKIKRDSLDPIDKQIRGVIEQLKDYIDTSKFTINRAVPNTYELARDLRDNIPEIIKKAKGSPHTDEETKRKLADQEKIIQEFGDKFTKAEQEYNSKLKVNGEEWETKFHDYRLGGELEKIGNKFTLAEAYESTRSDITEVLMSKIRRENNLKLGEINGKPAIFVNDEHGKPKFLKDSNTPVTIDLLLNEAYKPFLKKSEGDGQTQVNTRTTATVTKQNPTIRRGASTTLVQKEK